MMKRLLAIAAFLAAFLLASSTAQAQYTFEYGGHTIRIDPDRGTVSIPGVYDNTGRKTRRARSTPESGHSKQPPQEAKSDSPAVTPSAPAHTPTAPATPVPPPARSDGSGPRAKIGAISCGRSNPPARAGTSPHAGATAARPCPRNRGGQGRQLAGRHLDDRREGRQGSHRTVRRQSLRIFGRREI